MRAANIYRIAHNLMRIAEEKSFEEAIEGRTFKNPNTGNDVKFNSLPDEEQKKIRGEWAAHVQKGDGGGDGVSKAKAGLSSAEKKLKDMGVSDDERDDLAWNMGSDGDGIEFNAHISKKDMEEVFRQNGTTSEKFMGGLKEKDRKVLEPLLGEGSKTIPSEVFKDKDSYKAWSKEVVDTFQRAVGKIDDRRMSHFTDVVKDYLEGEEMGKALAVGEYMTAKKNVSDAESKAKKSEKTKSPEEMSTKELIEQYEDMIENSKMKPEEKKKAIKRMKEKSPTEQREQSQAALKSVQTDGEEGTGKTASDLMFEIRRNQNRIAALEERLHSLRYRGR